MDLAAGRAASASGRRVRRREMEYAPALLAVELVAHVLAQLLEVALRLGVVGVHHQVLEMPEAPAEVLEPLALLEEAGDLCADL